MADVYKQSFKQNYTNNIELSIFNCGIERCAPGQTWGPGIRDHYLIHLVLSGKGVFEVGGRTWEVSQGQLFFARPSQLIRYTADEQQPWEYSWVGFNGACAHKLAAQLPFTDDSPVHHTHDPDGMRDGSFLKLKNMELGYTFKRMRFYISGSNLLTFSKFDLWDPEQGGGSGLKYPTQRVFNVGFQMTFNN